MRLHLFGASSPLGLAIASQARAAGVDVACYSRTPRSAHSGPGPWLTIDLNEANSISKLSIDPSDWLVSAAPLTVFARSVGSPECPSCHRVVLVGSASAVTKADSPWPNDRSLASDLLKSEVTLQLKFGKALTVLRPTMIYGSGHDRNIARLAMFIRRYRAIVLCKGGHGLRAPIHVDDLAAIVFRTAASNFGSGRLLNVPGSDLLEFRDMVRRVADATGRQVAILTGPPVPPILNHLASAMPSSVERILAAYARTERDLSVPDDVSELGVSRRSFRPCIRSLGLIPSPN
jgi:nucleoside-diphosphate-sugar epimerase